MKQLHPRAVWFFFISYIIRLFFFFLFFGIWVGIWVLSALSKFPEFSEEIGLMGYVIWFFVLLVVLVALSYVWARLSYRYYRYELREDGFRKESGVITKKYVTIPYDRIQNVDIYRGLLARILGLSDLQIQTAGASAQVTRSGVIGAGAEGRLLAVSFEVAEKLRDELIRRAKRSKNQGL